MSNVVTWIQTVALGLGGPGLFLIAFLDSSFLSLPQINDLLIIAAVTAHPERMPLYAGMATLGSLVGCTVMYLIGRKGGEALLRRRFKDSHVAHGLAVFQRYGVLAVLIPALLPPPAPFKIFVMLAGVARVPLPKFWLAVALGRGVRYVAEGLLAIKYGNQALEFMRVHGREMSLWLAAAVLAGGLLYVLWRKTRASPAAGSSSGTSPGL